jgi:hypothetical protein
MNVRIILIFLIIIFQLASVPEALADRRLDLFLKKYNEVKGRIVPMGHEDSPFYRYNDRRFEEGLDKVQLKLLHKAQKRGDCILAVQLVKEGFIGLYPFLKPAFDDVSKRARLTTLIFSSMPPETTRCNAHDQMKEVFARRKRDEFPPVDFAERHPNYQEWKEEEKRDPGLKKLRLTLGGFGNAAFCDDYRPSIADLRAIVNRPGGMALTPEEELFLLERARMHNLEISDYDKTSSRLKKYFISSERFLRLRDASRRGKLVDIHFPVDGYWQESCRSLMRFRREEK